MKSNRFCVPSLVLMAAGICLCLPSALPAQSPPDRGRENSTASQGSSAAIAATSSMEVLDDKRPLEVGDVIAFRVVEDRSAPFSLIVTDSGEVEFPFIGRVYVRGKTPKTLAYEIKAELEKEHYQKATVIIGLDWLGTRREGIQTEERKLDRVNVWGAVGRAGPVAIPPEDGLTIAEAILAAGGFTPFAKRKKVRVHRIVSPEDGETTPDSLAKSKKKLTQIIIVNVKDIIEDGDLSKNIALKPNDVVIVEEKFFNF